MDYALERASGLVDLVEIEASTHALFNQKGNPSEHLVHAEQQVIDWLNWIEQNSAYARVKLPGLMQPVGYVIIGRSGNLSSDDRQRLHRRNIIFRNSIIILTYDDLLSRAELLLSILEGKQPSVSKA